VGRAEPGTSGSILLHGSAREDGVSRERRRYFLADSHPERSER
jgi:hypothetical protein